MSFVHPWVRHLKPSLFPERAGDSVGGVDPAVGVDDVLAMSRVMMSDVLMAHLWDIVGVDAVYGVAHVLLRRHDEREGEEARGRHGVVEAEHPRVDVHVGHPQEAAQLAEDLQHLGG